MGTDAPVADDGKWRSGFRSVLVDCPLAVAWDLFADWGNWSWQTSKLSNEVRAGESGKLGCLRLVVFPDWQLRERVVEVDAEQHFLKYAIEENNVFGGKKGFTGCVKVKESEDGKTMLEYWMFELEPLESTTTEEFCSVLNKLLIGMMGELEKGAPQITAQPGLDHVKQPGLDHVKQLGLDHVKQASAV